MIHRLVETSKYRAQSFEKYKRIYNTLLIALITGYHPMKDNCYMRKGLLKIFRIKMQKIKI